MVEEHCPLGCFRGGINYRCLLGLYTVYLWLEPTFRRTYRLHLQNFHTTVESYHTEEPRRSRYVIRNVGTRYSYTVQNPRRHLQDALHKQKLGEYF
jgi:hypothetical protein